MSAAAHTTQLVGAVDQGTSSSRFLVFNSKTSELVAQHQIETRQIFQQEGWLEEDPMEILQDVTKCWRSAVQQLLPLGLSSEHIQCVGITSQGVSTVVWDKETGQPLHNAITWLDTRTAETAEILIQKTPDKNKDYLRPDCGLSIDACFSALKLRWLLHHSDTVRAAVTEGRCLFGTVNTWLLWNFTGGACGGLHLTDVSNASMTMLMNIHTLQWDEKLCSFFEIPQSLLPEIRSSSEVYGHFVTGALKGIPLSGMLMDQNAALVGQRCFEVGEAKCTYGTGCFLMYNTGHKPVESKTGMATVVGYQFGPDKPPVYALMGAASGAGVSVRWLRDNLGILDSLSHVESLARQVDGTHGCCFVPAFSGLFGTRWDVTARGIICGLSQFTTKHHIARAALEAVCFQIREVVEGMRQDSGVALSQLRVDGGMTKNNLLMQLQADLLNISVVRPAMQEATALGAAFAAGLALGLDIRHNDCAQGIAVHTFTPRISQADSDARYSLWLKAVERAMHWETPSSTSATQNSE